MNFKDGSTRVEAKRDNEGGGLSLHALVKKAPTETQGHIYPMLYEDVNGFGRTVLQTFLRSELRRICEELDVTYKKKSGNVVKSRPMLELNGHPSDQLKQSLKNGKLVNIEAVSYSVDDPGMDEGAPYIKSVRHSLSLSIDQIPDGESLSVLEKMKIALRKKGYKDLRVRWKELGKSKPLTAKVDTARQDAGEQFFIRSIEINLKDPLPDISDKLCSELVDRMAAHL